MAKQLNMDLTKGSMNRNKVVDNILTRLADLSEALDNFYQQLDRKLDLLNFKEINSIITDGLSNIVDGKCPIDIVPDVESCTETFSYNSDEGEYEDENLDIQAMKDDKGGNEEEENKIIQNKKQKEVAKILEIMRSMSG